MVRGNTGDVERVVVYSDYVCPFCYLGKVSLEQARDQVDEAPDIEWRPFDLRLHKRRDDHTVDHDVKDWKDSAYFQRVTDNVRRLSREYGVEMTLGIAGDVDSWNAHKIALSLVRQGRSDAFSQFHDAVFEALWRDGRNIGDVDVLVDVAGSAGLDEEEVRTLLADEELDGALHAKLVDAQRSGITGVPTFARGDVWVPGAVPPDQLVRFLQATAPST